MFVNALRQRLPLILLLLHAQKQNRGWGRYTGDGIAVEPHAHHSEFEQYVMQSNSSTVVVVLPSSLRVRLFSQLFIFPSFRFPRSRVDVVWLLVVDLCPLSMQLTTSAARGRRRFRRTAIEPHSLHSSPRRQNLVSLFISLVCFPTSYFSPSPSVCRSLCLLCPSSTCKRHRCCGCAGAGDGTVIEPHTHHSEPSWYSLCEPSLFSRSLGFDLTEVYRD